MQNRKGFTLIELLVVIAIIAILAGLIIIRIGSVSLESRTTKRKADISQINKAFEIFRNNGGNVKPCTPNCSLLIGLVS